MTNTSGSTREDSLLAPALKKNDRKARWLIVSFSVIIFAAIVALGRVKLNVDLGFDPHLFAKVNAIINSIVAVLLISGLIAVKHRNYVLHKRIMLSSLLLSVIFLVSYVCHHLFTGDTRYGGVGAIRYVYFVILITHIFLAAIVLPFVLFTAYRALVAEWPSHVKLARLTWPVWLYVSITGPIVYLMISPYY